MKEIITTKAPEAIGSYSQAIEDKGTLWTSMQIGLNPDINWLSSSFSDQVKQTMDNLREILKAAEYDWKNVVKVSVYLIDISDFIEMNKIYSTYLKRPFPAREVIAVGSLPLGAKVGISLVARNT